VADAIWVLFLTFGAVFPSPLAIPDAGEAMPEEFYGYTAKVSPFEVPAEPKRAKAKVPVVSARALPLLSQLRAEPERAGYQALSTEYPMRASVAVASLKTP
jgi:hypothetical protein